MGEHLVAGARLVTSSPTATTTPAASTPSTSEGWRPTSQPPYSDDLVLVVGNSAARTGDHDVVRSERTRRRQLEHLHLAPERLDANARISRPFPAKPLS